LRYSFLILLILFSPKIYSQNSDTVYVDAYAFLNTGKNIILKPISFNKSDLLNLSGVILLTSGAFLLDHEVKVMAGKNINNFNKHLFNIDHYYYVPAAAALAGGIYLYGFISEEKEFRQLGLDLGEAAFYANTLNILLKFASGRSRPLRTDDNNKFHPFQSAPIHSSFASAHTTLAFAVSTVMSSYSDNIFWKTGWYTAAGLVGAARVYRRMHWFSDVILGAAIGYYIGTYVVDKDTAAEVTLLPGGMGIKINL
jgi:membrane-associated phospholipid phosphatase